MTTLPRWFVFVLVGNACLTLGYFLGNLFGNGEKNRGWGMRAAVMLLCPGAGVCLLLLSWLFSRLVFRAPVDLSDVVFSKKRVESAGKADEEQEVNFVPLEEAIAISDRRDLRELMLNIVREDAQDSLPSIALALNSEDTETAHYAASVLQEALNDFRAEVQRTGSALMDAWEGEDGSGGDGEIQAAMLLEVLNGMLEKRVLTDLEQSHYVHLMDEVGEELRASRRDSLNSGQMEQLALRHLEIGDYPLCEKWCLRAARQYPNTLSAYTTRMKLYFSNGEREKFFSVMEQLKKSDIVIDRETLELIRVFS